MFKELFSLLPEVPDPIQQFVSELSQDSSFISLDAIQNFSIIPFLSEVLKAFTNEKILSLTLSIIDYLLNLDFSILSILDQNDIFTLISNFFDNPSDQIQIKIAKVFHSAVLYDSEDSDQSDDETNKDSEDQNESDADSEYLKFSTFYKIINLFLQRSYIWASNIKNEELQIICIDFQLIAIDIAYEYKQISRTEEEDDDEGPLTNDVIKTLCDLYLQIFKVGSEKLQALSLFCSYRIMVEQKKLVFDPKEITQISLKKIRIEDDYLDHLIFQFLSALATLILNLEESLSFLHEFINFQFLCEKMVASNDKSTLFYLCLLFDTFINNGPDSIEVLLKANFLECCKYRLLNGSVYYCNVISASIKDIFLLGTANQLISVFQSGIVTPLLQFFEDSQNETSSSVIDSICKAIQKCTEELGSNTFQTIQTIFFNDSLDVLTKLKESNSDIISQYVDKLFEVLGL